MAARTPDATSTNPRVIPVLTDETRVPLRLVLSVVGAGVVALLSGVGIYYHLVADNQLRDLRLSHLERGMCAVEAKLGVADVDCERTGHP